MLSALGARLSRAWYAYEGALQSRPVLTQSLTSTGLWAAGDLISQSIDGADHFDKYRTGCTGVFGAALVGPLGHAWYKVLDQATARRFVPGTYSFVAFKVAADVLAFGPVHLVAFFGFMTATQGGTWEDVKSKIRRDFWSAYAVDFLFWPAFQAWNFTRVPLRHQLLAVNGAALVDCTFLCWVQSQDDWLARIGLRSPQHELLQQDQDHK